MFEYYVKSKFNIMLKVGFNITRYAKRRFIYYVKRKF